MTRRLARIAAALVLVSGASILVLQTLGAPALGAPALSASTFGAPALGAPTLGASTLGVPTLGAWALPATASSTDGDDCAGDASERLLTFDSGASWRFCAGIDDTHGLHVEHVRYRAPGDIERSVLSVAHPAGALVQTVGEAQARSLFAADDRRVALPVECPSSDASSGGGETAGASPSPCIWYRATGLLTKYGDLDGVQGGEWRLVAESEGLDGRWRDEIAFGETGRITLATTALDDAPPHADPGDGHEVLATWRVAFALDGAASDTVEEFDFTLRPDLGSRRPMRVTPLAIEALRTVAHDRFRGWRVRDAGGAGYYLDSQRSGGGWSGAGGNWTRFDLAVTARSDCEQEAAPAARPRCADSEPPSLDRWVDGESLEGQDPVLWVIGASPWRAGAPATLSLELTPFDWNDRSAFVPAGDGA